MKHAVEVVEDVKVEEEVMEEAPALEGISKPQDGFMDMAMATIAITPMETVTPKDTQLLRVKYCHPFLPFRFHPPLSLVPHPILTSRFPLQPSSFSTPLVLLFSQQQDMRPKHID